ncbi:Peroxidase 19 [Acorus calamus]|uniref:Peroxidase n=1 Tax=Acorus calamus TaxID=4465 RepID=A0AAV9F711_ACOCL|nr:Peroxidase 19 [Acorus calamus]
MSVHALASPLLTTLFCFFFSFYFVLASDTTLSNGGGYKSSSSLASTTTNTTSLSNQLSIDFYSKSCPNLEQLVGSVTSQRFKEAPVTGPATIRLFFHDCFVEGCDASVLIEAKPRARRLPEKSAEDNRNLAVEAFDVVKKAKGAVEAKCPGVVSCADILAVAARDFVHLAGGPYYQVKKGRRDGKISRATRVKPNLPRANSTVADLLTLFASKGLTQRDLVALSGAHTIGFSHCDQFLPRLYNYANTQKPDPRIDPRLLKALRMSCPARGGNADVVAPFDVKTPFEFDHAYYGNLEGGLGLLETDQGLYADGRTKGVVVEMGRDKEGFFKAFVEGMERMGSIGVKTGRKGEVRRDCSRHVKVKGVKVS